jgi:hypothetical protein
LRIRAVHHKACCSAIGGMAPTPGRTKPMNAMSGREAWMMLRMLACEAVG